MANYELNVKINGVEESISTIGQLESSLTATNNELANVQTNSNAFVELNNQASQINSTFTSVATEAGTLNQQLANVSQSATKLGDAASATMRLNQEIKETGQTVQQTDTNIQKATNSSTSLRAELRRITQELQNLEPGSARFQELSNRAGELRDQIQDTNSVIQATAGNTTERFGTALSTTIGVGITGFQGLVGAAQLFGSENEALTQTLLKLQGLLNLTQAITAFGGLRDQITQITAGFGLFNKAQTAAAATTATTTAATVAETAAVGASTVAVEGATVATGALGTAMAALPIIGLVAALGALAFGLYQYTSANSEAKKAEEERQKELEKQKAEEEEYASTIATESAEFLQLAYQLKQTTAASEERRKLVNTINAEYGSTLQNLADEALFQEQLNTVIKDYIALQVTKYKIKENEGQFEEAIKKQVAAEKELNQITQGLNKNFMVSADFRKAALGDYQAEIRFRTELGKKYQDFNLDRTFELQSLKTAQEEYNGAVNKFNTAQKTLESLTKQRTELVKQERDYLDEIFPKREQVGKQTKTQIADIEKLSAVEKFRLELNREIAQQEIETALDKAKRTASEVDDIEAQRNAEIASIDEKLKAAIDANDREKKSNKKKADDKKLIEADYTKYVTDLNAAFQKRIDDQIALEKAARELAIADLKVQYAILQEEITFGDQNVADSFIALELIKKEAAISRIDEQLQSEKLSQKEYEALLQERLTLQIEYLKLDEKVKRDELIRSSTAAFQNYKKLLEEQYKVKLNVDENTILASKRREGEETAIFQQRLIDEGIIQKKSDDESQTAFENRVAVEAQAFENLVKTKENLDEEYRKKKKLLDSQNDVERAQATIDTENKISESRLKILQDYFTLAKNSLSVLAQGSAGPFADLLSNLLDTVDQITQLTTQKFESTAEKVAAYAAVIGAAINAVIGAFVQANQQALDEDLKNFEIASNERKDQLAREYNAGLISREQYDKGIKAADDQLKRQQLQAKKDAFEQDKKLRIAQAIIAGAQGAVSAFAGAMTIPPPAGPILGGILAGLVAALTAVQVAAISKQKFDAGGTTVAVNTPTVSTEAATAVTQASSGGFTSFNQNVMGPPTGTGTTTPFSAGGQKVYVLESDITSAQDRVRVLESNSTFG
jgi:hypothetical protein